MTMKAKIIGVPQIGPIDEIRDLPADVPLSVFDEQSLLRTKSRQARQAEARAILKTAEARGREPLASEKRDFDALMAEVRALDEEIIEIAGLRLERQQKQDINHELGRRFPSVRVGHEPGTYRRGGEHSYFRDLARANAPGGGDHEARERLQRHGQEVRANMNRTDGTGGEFVPPLWLMDQYVALARAGRVTAELCNKQPLPGGTDSINLPKVATGASVAEQSDGASASNTDMTTSSVSGAVTTLVGQQVFAMQLLDQSPISFDEVVFGDLTAELAKQIDIYVINKASIGILNVTGISSVTYTDASPTVPELYPKVADAIQRVATNRFLPAQAIVMTPARWAWHLASLDSSNRPLVVPNQQGPTNAFAGFTDVRAEGSVGSLQGLPVFIDNNIPQTLGGGTEDAIIVARFDDLFLYESDVRTRVLFETDADTLKVRLQVWEYLAFIGGRYPKSISKITGTGLAAPTF